MKLLFVHGGSRIKKDQNGKLYVDGNLNNQIFQRYLNYCDELTFFIREEEQIYDVEFAKKKFNSIMEDPRFKILTTVDLMTPKTRALNPLVRAKIRRDLKRAIAAADKVIVRDPGNFYTINASRIAKKMNKPLLVEVASDIYDSYWYHGTKLGKIVAKHYDNQARKIIKNADYAAYVTEKFLQSRYPSNGKCLACSDVEIPEPNQKILLDRLEKINQNKDKIVLGTIGFVHIRWKGQQDVIRAMKKLKDKGYKIKYQLVGIGDNSYLKNLAAELGLENEVEFIGGLPHDDVIEWLKNIDIYIQPSYTEGVCRALVEAMSMACPTITSDGGGNIELCNPGFVFPHGDLQQIEEVITKMTQEERRKYAKINFERSAKYSKNLLDQKRNQFYYQFRDDK